MRSFDDLRRRNAALERQLDDYSMQLRDVKAQLAAERQRGDKARRHEDLYAEAIDALRKKVSELEKNASPETEMSYKERIAKAEEVVSDLKQQLSAKDEEISGLRSRVSELEDTVGKYGAELEESRKQLASDKIVINSLTEKIAGQESALAGAKGSSQPGEDVVEKLTERIASLEEKIKSLDESVSVLSEKLSAPAPEDGKKEPEARGDRSVEEEILGQIDYYRQQAGMIQDELDRFGHQIAEFEDYIYSRRNPAHTITRRFTPQQDYRDRGPYRY